MHRLRRFKRASSLSAVLGVALLLAASAAALVASGRRDGTVPSGAVAPAHGDSQHAHAVAAAPAFRFSATRLSAALRHRMRGDSWRPGCPVALRDLRLLSITTWGFDGTRRRGRMVVNADVVDDLRAAFERLYERRFPIRRMRLVDDYGGEDSRSIEADNTSAFNCRSATGSTRFSEHAYGRAIDINPLENPYVYADGTTTHRRSRPYLNRSHHRKGMAFAGGVLVRAFDAVRWGWGGRWPLPTDYQHFSRDGR